MSSVDPHPIDELLNSMIDGELTAAEEADVRLRVDRDREVAKRLQKLRDCQKLVCSLPKTEAPADLPERVLHTLERRRLLGEVPSAHPSAQIARRLMARRMVAVAATIGLVGVLSVLVYSILLSPAGSSHRTIAALRAGRGPVAPGEVRGIRPEPLIGRLELQVASTADMEMFFNRIMENHGLASSVSNGGSPDRRVYRLHCGLGTFEAILADLAGSWHMFGCPTFYLETGQLANSIVVTSVTPDQLERIAEQRNGAMSAEAASQIAVANSADRLMPGRDILAAVVDKNEAVWPTVVKPVLTSSEKPVGEAHKQPTNERSVEMAIILIAGR